MIIYVHIDTHIYTYTCIHTHVHKNIQRITLKTKDRLHKPAPTYTHTKSSRAKSFIIQLTRLLQINIIRLLQISLITLKSCTSVA